jgi:hypothetical protein
MTKVSRELKFKELMIKIADGMVAGEEPGEGWFFLGDKVDTNKWEVWVKSADAGKKMVVSPEGYEDLGRVPGSRSLHYWRPIPPEGYRALSDLISDAIPDGFRLGCIRDDTVDGFRYVHPADVNPNNEGKKWYIIAPRYTYGLNGVKLTPNGFRGSFVVSDDQPVEAPTQYVLHLPIAYTTADGPSKPKMNSREKPVEASEWAEDRRATVPCLAVEDSKRNLSWQVEHSPLYTGIRKRRYFLEIYVDNDSDTSQTESKQLTVGIEKSKTEAYRASVGITIGAEAGVSSFGAEGKLTTSVTAELGYEVSETVTVMQHITYDQELTVRSKHAGALYNMQHHLQFLRENGTWAGDHSGIEFKGYMDIYITQYPPVKPGEEPAVHPGNPANVRVLAAVS